MDEDRRPGWPMIGGIAAVAAVAGFGIAHLLAPGQAPPPARAEHGASTTAQPAELKIPAAYIATADIAVEPVATGGVGDEVIAPAKVVAMPMGEAIVVARAAGIITRINRQIGDSVRAGETLALVDSADAASMAADTRVAAAKADLARKAFAREQGLFQQGVTPRQDMETAQSALAVAEAEARRAASVAHAAHVSGGSAASVSPISGRITGETATLGAFVEPRAELFRVAGSNAVQIEASVTAADARRIRAGDPASILLDSGSPIAATVRSVTPTVNAASQSATVLLTPSAGASALIAGQGVQVRIRAQENDRGGGMAVPEDAVQSLDGRDILFVRTRDGFRAQPVLVGARTGGLAQILSGVKPGDRVATRNAFLLKAESKKGAEEE
jgi:cobalt-zinc-cadmium efflux system membrane fusion protein